MVIVVRLARAWFGGPCFSSPALGRPAFARSSFGRVALLAIVALVFGRGCVAQRDEPSTAPAFPYPTVRGRIVDGGTPYTGYRVVALDLFAEGCPELCSGRGDLDGRFELVVPTVGPVVLRFEGPGGEDPYLSPLLQLTWRQEFDLGTHDAVAEGSVRGRVFRSTGVAATGAKVTLRRDPEDVPARDELQFERVVAVDEDGTFAADELRHGIYWITVDGGDDDARRVVVVQSSRELDLGRIELADASVPEPFQPQEFDWVQFDVHALDPDGEPAAGAVVFVDTPELTVARATLDDEGRATLALPETARSWIAYASHPDWSTAPKTCPRSQLGDRPLELHPRGPGSSVHGSVLSPSSEVGLRSGAVLEIWRRDAGPGTRRLWRVTVDSRGVVTLPPLRDGAYGVAIWPKQHNVWSRTTSWSGAGRAGWLGLNADVTTLTVGGDEVADPVSLEFDVDALWTGTVENTAGEPLADCFVVVGHGLDYAGFWSDETPLWRGSFGSNLVMVTDGRGRFAFENRGDDAGTVAVLPCGSDRLVQGSIEAVHHDAGARDLRIVVGTGTVSGEVEVRPGWSVSSLDSFPEETVVFLCPLGRNWDGYMRREDGVVRQVLRSERFSFGYVPAGEYVLLVGGPAGPVARAVRLGPGETVVERFELPRANPVRLTVSDQLEFENDDHDVHRYVQLSMAVEGLESHVPCSSGVPDGRALDLGPLLPGTYSLEVIDSNWMNGTKTLVAGPVEVVVDEAGKATPSTVFD